MAASGPLHWNALMPEFGPGQVGRVGEALAELKHLRYIRVDANAHIHLAPLGLARLHDGQF